MKFEEEEEEEERKRMMYGSGLRYFAFSMDLLPLTLEGLEIAFGTLHYLSPRREVMFLVKYVVCTLVINHE